MAPLLSTFGGASVRGYGRSKAGFGPNYTAFGNYIGNGSDGDVVISANTSLVVPNKVGSYDGDMVVKQYKSLTINSGVTLTTDQPCRGMFIFVQGDCTINGSLSMSKRGAYANPDTAGVSSDGFVVDSSGLKYGFIATGGTSSLTMSETLFNGCGVGVRNVIKNQTSGSGTNYKVITVAKYGMDGGVRSTATPSAGCVVPPAASPGMSGGGTSGGGYNTSNGYYPGSGGQGSCFSGGSGGGGYNSNGAAGYPGNGTNFGGPGGNGFSDSGLGGTQYNRIGGGGAGNGRGSTWNSGTSWEQAGAENGTGGLLFLIVGGTLTINSGGLIEANGAKGSPGGAGDGRGGGSGGGVVNVLYKNIINNGVIQAVGVPSSTGSGNQGGDGSTQVFQML